MAGTLLEVDGVSKTFVAQGHRVDALKDVSLAVGQGECVAVVGESGSGKSTLANIVVGIYGGHGGTVMFDGERLPQKRSLAQRRKIQLVQQNPYSSLNPMLSVGRSVRLPLEVHKACPAAGMDARVASLLAEVGLDPGLAHRRANALSGGQLQRVAIARALACGPSLLVLDEPTSALDVLVQARVLRLLADLRPRLGLSYLFITHDLSVVRNMADRVAVFEKGKMVETAATEDLFSKPGHPYTRSLIGAVPVITKQEELLREGIKAMQAGGENVN